MQSKQDAYLCLTPYGVAFAMFPPDARGVELSGPEDAVALVKREIESSTDIDGISLTVDRLEPDQLVTFCQREGGPISVMPPLEPE